MSSYTPPMAKIRKKKFNTIIVSFRRGMAFMTESTNIRRPLIMFKLLRGLITRKALSELISRLSPSSLDGPR